MHIFPEYICLLPQQLESVFFVQTFSFKHVGFIFTQLAVQKKHPEKSLANRHLEHHWGWQ